MRPTNTNYANIAFGGVFFAFYARALSICMMVFRCVLASLREGLSVRRSVGPSVGPSACRSIRPLVRWSVRPLVRPLVRPQPVFFEFAKARVFDLKDRWVKGMVRGRERK